jgi:hypothetical protein
MTTLEKAAQAAWSKKFGTPFTALEGTQWEDIFRDEWVSVVQAAFEAVKPIDPHSVERKIAAIIRDIVDSDLDGNLIHVDKAAATILAAAPPVDGWQPIETAPRDGGDILLTYGGDDCTVARPNGDGSFDDGDFRDHLIGFTHWMPIPQPPNNERTG